MTFYNQHSTALVGAAGQPDGYFIDRSLRLRSSVSAYLSRTFTSAGNRRTWTYSCWVKRSKLSTGYPALFCAPVDNSELIFHLDDALQFYWNASASNNKKTDAKYRDVSAWYHVVAAIDTTQATAGDRVKLYINGERITSFGTSTDVALNYEGQFNNSVQHNIGKASGSHYLDGYITEINFVDGQQLDSSYFGETDLDTGVWKPKRYAGSYGTNGFYLNFSDNTSTTTLGYDTSGNSNNWTTNNISLTAGSTYDSMQDVPTLTSENAGNFATLNAVHKAYGSVTYSNGNLQGAADTNWNAMLSTINVTSGKWYWEYATTTTNAFCGVQSQPQSYNTTNPQNFSGTIVYNAITGAKRIDGTETSYGASYTSADTIGVALDIDGGTITFYKNNSSQGSISLSSSSNMVGKTIAPVFISYNSTSIANFGQRPFAYTPPTGYKALNTYNLPDSTIEDGGDYFNTVLYTGNGGTQSVTGVGFQPDWVWLKKRSDVANHNLIDSVRGAGYSLFSNTTDSETNYTTYFASFGTDGFNLTNGGGSFNASGGTYVAWNWKANGSGVSNTDGSITSTVSANTTSGFSIVTYTANNTAGSTIGHGLGVAPKFIIVKSRNNINSWNSYHSSLGNTKGIDLNSTNAANTSSNYWNNTSPTSSVFSVALFTNNSTYTYVAYCFAEIEGFSAFGSYTGNGSTDGTFVYTGFRPAFVLVKSSNLTYGWVIVDTVRNTYNVINSNLFPHASAAEDSSTGYFNIDAVSNGFKVRTSNAVSNQSGGTYIYAAFAENPFKYSLAR